MPTSLRLASIALCLTGLFGLAHAQPASAPEAVLPDTPGSGAYPALKEEVASLPDHVVYRPAKLEAIKPKQLGLYVFGNGACSDDGASSRMHLLEIASHGYVAIALGRIRTGPGVTLPLEPPAPRPSDAQGRPVFPPSPTNHKGLMWAIDWALAQNADPKSPYFGKLDPSAIAVSGFSCGGLQALRVAPDPRVKTLIVMNSGIFVPGTGPQHAEMSQPKSLLDQIRVPALYVLGGPTDIAYNNGMDDFERINHVPVAVANLKGVGHGGTYMQPNGGKAAAAVVAWLNWQMKGDKQAAKAFVGANCGLCTDAAWELRKKKID
jgi:hypothetical protein